MSRRTWRSLARQQQSRRLDVDEFAELLLLGSQIVRHAPPQPEGEYRHRRRKTETARYHRLLQSESGAAPLKGRYAAMRDDVVGVAGLVDTVVLLCQVEPPVLVEVAVAAHGTELEDGFGASPGPIGHRSDPSGPSRVSARAFDHARGDRPPLRQRCRVVEVGGLVGSGSRRSRRHPCAPLPRAARSGALRRIPAATSRAPPPQDGQCLSRTQASAVVSPSSKKHQAAVHRYSSTWMRSTTTVIFNSAPFGFFLDAVDLVAVAVDQGDPGALVLGSRARPRRRRRRSPRPRLRPRSPSATCSSPRVLRPARRRCRRRRQWPGGPPA